MLRLFVYGTLKRGCRNHHHLAGQRYLGDARTPPGYRLFDLGDYPGMIPDPTDQAGVTGEIWEVTPTALDHLDDFEGVAEGLYRRTTVRLLPPFDTGEIHTYIYARDPGSKVIGPTWIDPVD